MADNEAPAKPVKVKKVAAKPKAEAEAKPKPEPKAEKEAARKAKELDLAEDSDEASEEDAREGAEEQVAPAKGKPAKAAPKKKAAAKDEDSDEDDGDDEESGSKEPAAKKGKSKPRPRPKLDADLKEALELRRAKNAARPRFRRQEGFRYQRLGDKWRFPQGIQSKMRRHWGTHADVVSIGHRGPKAARGLHPSGFREVMVHNAQGLDGIDPAKEAVRIASSVGKRKREEIQKDARKLGIRVLNWRQY